MIRIRGLSREQLAALMQLAEDNQSFEAAESAPGLRVVEGGCPKSQRSHLQSKDGIAPPLHVVG